MLQPTPRAPVLGRHRLRSLARAEKREREGQRRGDPEGFLCCLETRKQGRPSVAHLDE